MHYGKAPEQIFFSEYRKAVVIMSHHSTHCLIEKFGLRRRTLRLYKVCSGACFKWFIIIIIAVDGHVNTAVRVGVIHKFGVIIATNINILKRVVLMC